MANDPHLENIIPSFWYLAEISFPHEGKMLHITGGSMSSLPIFSIGKTDYFSWGLTSMHCDNSDLYEETLRENNGTYEYLFENSWNPVKISKQVFKIKGK